MDTISQLLHSSNSQFRIYDIGRKIDKIPKKQFEQIELNQIPYPTPSQGHACFAVVFWQKQSPQPFIWLLKLPLDERGLLNQGARNHFIAIIIEALGSDLTQDANEQQTELLKSNPYLFTLVQYKLAALNSKIKFELKQKPSDHFTLFLTYLNNETDWNNWKDIGVQGITDFAARINENKHSQKLINALPHMPAEVLFPLCSALENELFSSELINALLNLLQNTLQSVENKPNETLIQTQQHLLRSLASNCNHIHVKTFVNTLLEQQNISPEILITLSGRCWPTLNENKTLMIYFEHLVLCKDAPLFNSIFKDLVSIPSIRPIVFECMRSPKRSNELSHAIGQLFN
tara:strand:- start:594 stop:1631 length:1038 start_codon:yes stop_codon:yes gene_type:complete